MKIFSTLALLLFLSLQTFAQTAITVSAEKVKVSGRGGVYYLHNIKKGETLYSLSKAYNVTIEEIVENNENAMSGLKAGEVLYIPAKDNNKSVSEKSAADKSSTAKSNSKRQKPKRHSVKWYEEIEDIAARYNVSKEDIMEYNNLESPRLTKRQVLLIPVWKSNANKTETLNQAGTKPSEKEEPHGQLLFPAQDSAESASSAVPEKEEREKPVRHYGKKDVEIALILPLTAPSSGKGYNSQYFDFYTGALVAASDLREKGINITVNVYDQNRYNTVGNIFLSSGFDKNQLVIGPVLSSALKEAADYAQRLGIPLVSPMDQNAEHYLNGNRYYIQAPAGNNEQIKNSVELLQNYCNDPQTDIMLVYQKGYEASDAVKEAREFLDSANARHSELSYNILEGRTINKKMITMMDTLKRHVVFVASNNEAFVNDVVRNLHLCMNLKRDITLIGLSKWRSFETIEAEDFHKMNLHLSLPFYIDYQREQVKSFLFRYRALFNVEPTPYSFQGYDLTIYFVGLLSQYGMSLTDMESLPTESLLQTAFDFRKIPGGGFKNIATKNIVYNSDYTISEIPIEQEESN